jgi:hypothetical protein
MATVKTANPVAAITAETKKTAAAAKAVWKILSEDFFPADLEMVKLYSAAQWGTSPNAERLGRGACLTLTFEGAVYTEMNYGSLQTKIDQALAALGLYSEQGYAWSLHIYPKVPRG